MNAPLNWNSRQLTRGWQRGVTAFYYGLGLTDADFDKPQIGIGVPLLDGNLCNLHAYDLAKRIAEGCRQAGPDRLSVRRAGGQRQHHPGPRRRQRQPAVAEPDRQRRRVRGQRALATTRWSACTTATRTARASPWPWPG